MTLGLAWTVNKRPALPYPAQALRDRQYLDASPQDTKTKLHDRLSQEYHDLKYRIDLLEARLNAVSTWQPVKKASATESAQQHNLPALDTIQASVGQLCWSNGLSSKYKNLGDSAGNISGVAWCNGVFLLDGYFLTAGHCFDNGGGWQRPNHYGVVSPPETMAPLFNVCRANDSSTDNRLQIEELTHHRPFGLDCSIVRLKSQSASENKEATPNVSELDLAHHLSDERTSDADAEVYLVDYQPSAENTQPRFHKVQINQFQQSLISFSSSKDERTLSGTPLITSNGKIIGIKMSDTEAVDIRDIAQILEAKKRVNQQHAQA